LKVASRISGAFFKIVATRIPRAVTTVTFAPVDRGENVLDRLHDIWVIDLINF
jgi:hypothetical protein